MKITFRHANYIECFEEITPEFAKKIAGKISSLTETICIGNYKDIGGVVYLTPEMVADRVELMQDWEYPSSANFGHDSDILEELLMEILR